MQYNTLNFNIKLNICKTKKQNVDLRREKTCVSINKSDF